ncbi:MAG: ATPase [Gammaproteobacteria bacterium]|nr:MAG: ATPase [Gammaproteobacteria bacterium]
MSFSLTQLFLLGVGYMSVLFFTAYVTEKGLIPARIVHHPAVYTLSLGIFASAWAIYGCVGFAYENGYNFLAYYLGISGTFLLAPILIAPILQLTQKYNLRSLADLFAYRYRSQTVGALTTIFLLIALLPLIALQIQAVSGSIVLLNNEASEATLAFVFCSTMTLFAILFGARHHDARRKKHEGLVMAIALETVVKIIVMISIGGYALFSVFNGPNDLDQWLHTNPQALDILYTPLVDGPWRSLIFAFFVATVVMPHMYHMTFTENTNPRALLTASWGLPLIFLIMALAVPLILWAAIKLNVGGDPEYFTLTIALASNSPVLATLVYLGGLSAASGLIIVTTLALSTMCINHLFLPIYQPKDQKNFTFSSLMWLQRLFIGLIILGGYLFYLHLSDQRSLTQLSLLAFFATIQFVPALVGVLFWSKANARAVTAGLITGFTVWIVNLFIPIVSTFIPSTSDLISINLNQEGGNLYASAAVGFMINAFVFTAISLLTDTSQEEKSAAESCIIDHLHQPQRWELTVKSTPEFLAKLSKSLGKKMAARELETALKELGMHRLETRPYALRRLRDQLETNLSGIFGPSVAQEIVDNHLPYETEQDGSSSKDIHFIESRLEDYRHRLSGLAVELDNLRRFHRQTLHDLPVGVCSLSKNGEILGWNSAIESFTGIKSERVIGSKLDQLKEPWQQFFQQFLIDSNTHWHQKQLEVDGKTRSLSLHKAALGNQNDSEQIGNLVIVMEDLTEIQLLEAELTHSERLASIGRLAAGVAHEVGNPITGIACLAQNMRYDTKNEEILEAADLILEQTDRVSRIVQSLVSFSHSGKHQQIPHEPVDINQCVTDAIDLIRLSPKGKNHAFENNVQAELSVMGDSQRLLQVFVNILGNARDACQPGDKIHAYSESDSLTATIYIEDQGPGIPAHILDRIFEPFVTTKDPGEGTGLGLSLAYSIIEDHYGHISIESPAMPNQSFGTRIVITLPCSPSNPTES